ncbi:GAK system XXXCH domain-containing protein [Desulfonatronospira sp.]|uniref:GAK system XXXCH domain-containing protein n=1 Tax=Desulfonatronospira sp. TaxID=1962951 RepID=UPI0025C37848|nr:GAK system XXXCH domain-containing protein [Desulfonatronospira sp.]
MSKGKKFSRNLSRQEASHFLTELSAALENREVVLQGEKIAWESMRKLKCSFYPSGDDLTLKVSVEQIRPGKVAKSLPKKKKDSKNALKKLKAGAKLKRSELKNRVRTAFRCIMNSSVQEESKADENAAETLQTPPATPSRSKTGYKTLKKRMKKTFAVILRNAANYQLPTQKEIDSFIIDSKAMVEFPGYGDEYYQEYMDRVLKMQEAFQRNDALDLMHKAQEVNQLQKDCHKQYK